MVTVHDVAARSGVSIATVSRTLRAPDRVAEDTRARVLAAIDELGYRPNRAAQGLRGGRTGVIGLVVPDIENPYFASLTKGAQARCRERGYGLVVVDTTESADVEAEEIAALAPQIDGIVLASSRLAPAGLLEATALAPSVLVNRLPPADATEPIPSLVLDELAAAELVIDYLHRLGHRRAVYLGGPASSWSQSRRSAGLHASAAAHGMELVELGPVTPDIEGGLAIADDAYAADATAVIAYNDLVAGGVHTRWRDRGIRIPDARSLVGFDNTAVTGLFRPAITSVGPDLRRFGETAVDLLIARIEQGPGAGADPVGEVQPRLVERGSTGPAPR